MTAAQIAEKYLGEKADWRKLAQLQADIKTYAHNVAQETLNEAACTNTYFNALGEQSNHVIADTEIHTP